MNNLMPTQEKREYRYFAFISYSRKDTKWAKWLQRKLQDYRLPVKLVREHKNLPKKIYPVFRDQQDISGFTLDEALESALEESRHLIVLCSPNSAASNYVNEEIKHFVALGRQDRILPLIIGGKANCGDPQAECFPPALRELNPEPLGIDVRACGKYGAFMRIVATLLHIHHDEILRRDGARRTFRRITAAAVALVLAATAVWAVWFNTPHSKYYYSYITHYEVPEGIGELTPEQRAGISSCYRITRHRGKVVRLECVNSRDVIVDPLVKESFTDYPRLEFVSYDREGRPTRIDCFDDEGMLVVRKIIQFSNSGNQATIDFQQPSNEWSQAMSASLDSQLVSFGENIKSEIIRQVNTYDASGKLLQCRYYRDTLGTPACDSMGIYGIEFAYDARGQVQRITKLNKNYEPLHYMISYATEVFTYDASGSVTEVQAFDSANGDPQGILRYKKQYTRDFYGNVLTQQYEMKTHKAASYFFPYRNVAYVYDRNGFCTGIRYFDLGNEPTPDGNGVHEYRRELDGATGKVFRETYLDTEGKPCTSAEGYGIKHILWDAQGRPLEYRYYDVQGQPAADIETNTYGIRYTYDSWGYLQSVTYLDPDGKPMRNQNWYAVKWLTNDENGRLLRQEYRDVNGEPVLNVNYYAAVEYTYDQYGNPSGEQYLDGKGKPARNILGYARKEWVYAAGHLVSERYFDTDGTPAVGVVGKYHAKQWEYDQQGYPLSYSYYDRSDSPMIGPEGYHKVVAAYDEKGNMISLRVFDENGSPMRGAEGYHEIRAEYDANGNMISGSYFDETGNPCLGAEGYHQIKASYDERGNIISLSQLDEGGHSLLGSPECYEIRMTYDEDGNMTSGSFFDKRGNPIPGPDGYHEARYAHDEYGNTVTERYYDRNGRPAVCALGYHMVQAEYDEKGNCIVQRCFGKEEEPVCNAWGIHSLRWEYDEEGNLIRTRAYDLQGNLLAEQ